MRSIFFIVCCVFASAFAKDLELPKDVTIDLLNPLYTNQIVKTIDGGVIKAEGVRIQAQEIEFDNAKNSVSASGNLLVEYGGRYFVGDSLEYNFKTKKGSVTNGRTNISLWFMGAEKILLFPDYSVQFLNPYLTTSENIDREWDIQADRMTINPESYAKAENVRFRFMHFPVLWLPSLRTYLKPRPDSVVRYKATWDKGQGARLQMRYRFYSWNDLNMYGRFDFRPDMQKLGVAGTIEADYKPEGGPTYFETRNFLTKDTFFNDNDPGNSSFRFRIQGLLNHSNPNKRTTFRSSWDWYDDKNLPLTFKGDDFELNTAKRTQALLRHLGDDFIAAGYVRPRINSFQGFKQELPTLDLALRPFQAGNSGIMFENRLKTSYLHYVYSDDIKNLLPDFESFRLSTNNNIYRAFHTPFFSFTPLAGFTGIFYDRSPTHGSAGQAIFRYEGLLNTKIKRNFSENTHVIEPYLHYKGLTSPTTSVDRYFVFGINDGYNRLNMLRMGLKNDLFTHCDLMPKLSIDLYGNGFFNADPYKLFIPKTYADILWNLDNLCFGAHGAWNFEESVLDYSNISALWTLNEDFAIYTEFRHRSKFDWRKDNHQNFILDITRPIDELLNTPISDGRNTLLGRVQYKFHPEWLIRIQSHMGWGRKNEPGYNEGKVDILHVLTTSWRLRTSFMWTARMTGITGVGGALNLSNQF